VLPDLLDLDLELLGVLLGYLFLYLYYLRSSTWELWKTWFSCRYHHRPSLLLGWLSHSSAKAIHHFFACRNAENGVAELLASGTLAPWHLHEARTRSNGGSQQEELTQTIRYTYDTTKHSKSHFQ
jgi:hypothetical protein